MPWLEEEKEPIGLAISIVIGGGGVLFFLYSFASTLYSRIELYSDRILDIGPLRTDELRVHEIAGFRFLATPYAPTLVLEPTTRDRRTIKTQLVYDKTEEIAEWLDSKNIKDLEAEEKTTQAEALLTANELGENEDERVATLERASKWAKVANIGSLGVAAWAAFRPEPYDLTILVSLAYPLAAIYLVYHFPKALQFDGKEGDPVPNVASAFIFPTLAVILRAAFDWNILEWGAFWAPFVLSSGAILLLIIKSFARPIKPFDLCVYAASVAAYGFAAVVLMNGVMDSSEAKRYKAAIVEKNESGGDVKTRTFALTPWGSRLVEADVEVSSTVYARYEVGDQVQILVHSGWLGIPWYFVR